MYKLNLNKVPQSKLHIGVGIVWSYSGGVFSIWTPCILKMSVSKVKSLTVWNATVINMMLNHRQKVSEGNCIYCEHQLFCVSYTSDDFLQTSRAAQAKMAGMKCDSVHFSM